MLQIARDLKSQTEMNGAYIIHLMFIAFVKINVPPVVLMIFPPALLFKIAL